MRFRLPAWRIGDTPANASHSGRVARMSSQDQLDLRILEWTLARRHLNLFCIGLH